MRKPYYAAIYDERDALVEKWVWSCGRATTRILKMRGYWVPKLTDAKLKHLTKLKRYELRALK